MKMLIIDDDNDFRSALRKTLEGHGFIIIEARNGKEGFDKLVADPLGSFFPTSRCPS